MSFRILFFLTCILLVGNGILCFANQNTSIPDAYFLEKYDNRSFNIENVIQNVKKSGNIIPVIIPEDGIQDVLPQTTTNYLTEGDIPVGGQTENSVVKAWFNKIFGTGKEGDTEKNGILTDLLDKSPEELRNVTLPAGMSYTSGSFDIKVAVVKAYFSPDYIQMDMLAMVTWKVKDKTDTLMLGAWGVRSYYGYGWPEVKFTLLQNEEIKLNDNLFLQLNGNYNNELGTVDLSKATYISMDCDGLESTKIFFRGMLFAPKESGIYNVVKNTEPSEPQFTIEDDTFKIDLNVEASLKSFYFEVNGENGKEYYYTYKNTDVIVGLKGFTLDFDVNKSNPSFISSTALHLDETNKGPEWQGLYVKEISLFLPSNATNGDSNERAMIAANDMIIDEEGLSVGVKTSGLENLKLQQKLPVQVKSVEVNICQNEIIKIRVEGQVSPALLKEGTDLAFWFMWLDKGKGNADSFNKSFDDDDGYYVGMAYGKLIKAPTPTVPPTEPVVEITDQTVYNDIPVAKEEDNSEEEEEEEEPQTSFIPAKLTVFRSYIFIPKNRAANEPAIEKFEITNMTIVTTGKIEGFKLAIENIGYDFWENRFLFYTNTTNNTKITFDAGERSSLSNFPIKIGYKPVGEDKEDTEIVFENNKLKVPISVCLTDKTFASKTSSETTGSSTEGTGTSASTTKKTEWAISGGGLFYYDWNKGTDRKGLDRFISRITVPALSVGVEFPSFAFDGAVRFYEPETSNGRSGFSGDVRLMLALGGKLEKDENNKLDESKNFTVTAGIDFGSIKDPAKNLDYRFWRVSASVVGLGVDLLPAPKVLQLDGFAGALAYHMVPSPSTDPEKMIYDPSANSGLYISAALYLNLVKYGRGKAGYFALFNPEWQPLFLGMNAEIELMVDLAAELGISDLLTDYNNLLGMDLGTTIAETSGINLSADRIEDINTFANKIKSTISWPDLGAITKTKIKLDALFQFDTRDLLNPELQAEANLSIKAGDLINGGGSVYLFVSKNDFYVHAGYKYYDFNIMADKTIISEYERWSPLGLTITFSKNIEADARAYFMLGNHIPTKLPRPVEDLRLTGISPLGLEKCNELNAKDLLPAQKSIGVAFGAAFSLKVETPKDKFIYGNAMVYAGALFNFTRYENIVCMDWQKDQTNKTFGFNNWYGEAEVFAGISAQLQAQPKIGNKRKIVNIAKAELGTLLKAEFPNPSWFYGTVWGYAEILNFIKVDYPLEIEFGTRCKFIEEPKENDEIDLPLVNRFSITNNKEMPETISVFDIPFAEFNYDFNKSIYVPGDSAELDKEYEFRVKGIQACDKNGIALGNIEVSEHWENNKKMHLKPIKPTDGQWPTNAEEIGLNFYVTMYESNNGGEWILTPNKPVYTDEEGQDLVEFDPEDDNTYLLDTTIWFKTGALATTLSLSSVVDTYPVIDQKYFFVGQTEKGHIEIKEIQSYLFKETDGTPKSNITVTFKEGNTIVGNSRADFLPDKNLLQYNLPSLSTGNEYTLEINNGDKVVLSYQFGTSKYPTFANKVSNIASIISEENAEPGLITATCEYGEPFDKVEIFGTVYCKNKPLVKAFGLLKDNRNSFYSNIVKPVMDNESFFNGLNPDPYNYPFPTWENGTEEYEIELSQKLGPETFEKAMITQSRFPYIYDISLPYETFISEFVPILGSYCPEYNQVYDFLIKYVKRTGNFCEYDFAYLINEHFPVKLTYSYGTENSGVVDFKYNKSTL